MFTLEQLRYLIRLVEMQKMRTQRDFEKYGFDVCQDAFLAAERMERTLQAAIHDEEALRG